MAKNEVAVMDWSGIKDEDKSKLIYYGQTVKSQIKKTGVEFLKLCNLVSEAHELLCKIGCKSRFGQWVELECGVSDRMGRYYVNVSAEFGGRNPETVSAFTPAAFIELSKPDTTESVKEQFVNSDIPVTGAAVKAAKRQAETVLEIPVKDSTVTDEPDIQAPGDDETEYEPADKPKPPPDWNLTRTLAVSLLEKAMRATDDLNAVHKYRRHDEVLFLIKDAIQFLKEIK